MMEDKELRERLEEIRDRGMRTEILQKTMRRDLQSYVMQTDREMERLDDRVSKVSGRVWWGITIWVLALFTLVLTLLGMQ